MDVQLFDKLTDDLLEYFPNQNISEQNSFKGTAVLMT